jgi:hypothetical protein
MRFWYWWWIPVQLTFMNYLVKQSWILVEAIFERG